MILLDSPTPILCLVPEDLKMNCLRSGDRYSIHYLTGNDCLGTYSLNVNSRTELCSTFLGRIST